ncbi:MAG: hypothetical protein ABW001_07750 [Mycobacterium sp.]
MQTFTIGIPRGGLLCKLGRRNRLVRVSDRIEALVTIAVVLFAVVIIPVIATFGTSFHQHQAAMYARQANSVHETIARVAANFVESGHSLDDVYNAEISWDVDGLPHVGTIRRPEPFAAGEQIPVWVDAKGNLAGKPPSPGQAATDAVLLAVFSWVTVVLGALGARRLLIWRLDRHRAAQWGRELEALVDGGGGRADRQA